MSSCCDPSGDFTMYLQVFLVFDRWSGNHKNAQTCANSGGEAPSFKFRPSRALAWGLETLSAVQHRHSRRRSPQKKTKNTVGHDEQIGRKRAQRSTGETDHWRCHKEPERGVLSAVARLSIA